MPIFFETQNVDAMKFNVKNPAEQFNRATDKLLVVNPSTRSLAQRNVSDVVAIINNLTSTDTDIALSANQGKVLKDLIDDLGNDKKTVWLFNPTLDQIDTIRIRRAINFDFSVEVAYNCEVITQPPTQSSANTNYLLSFKGTANNAILVVVLEPSANGGSGAGVAGLTFELSTANATVSPNTDFVVTALVQNSGPNQATNAVSEIYLPTGISFVSIAASGSYTYAYIAATRILRIYYANIANGGQVSAAITLTSTQSGSITGQIASCNQALTTGATGNGILGEPDDDTLAITTQANSVDLSLSLSASNQNPAINANVVFTATITNNSTTTNGTNIIWRGTLPLGLLFVGGSGVTYNSETNQISGSVSTIAPQIQNIKTFTVQVKPEAVLTTQTIVLEIVQATEADPDSTPNNNLSAEDDQAGIALYVQGTSDNNNNPDPAPYSDGDLWILDAEFIVNGTPQYGGGPGSGSGTRNVGAYMNVDVTNLTPEVNTNITLSVVVRNDSQTVITGETTTLVLPSGISYVSGVTNNFTHSAGTITIPVNSLAVGGVLLAQALIKATSSGAKTLTATLDNTVHTKSVSVSPTQNLRDISASVNIDANNTTPDYNDIITVSLFVQNNSGSAYSNEVLRHIIPNGKLQFVAFTTNPSNVASVSQGVITATFNLPVGDYLLIQFTAQVIAAQVGAFQITESIDGTIHSVNRTINYGN